MEVYNQVARVMSLIVEALNNIARTVSERAVTPVVDPTNIILGMGRIGATRELVAPEDIIR